MSVLNEHVPNLFSCCPHQQFAKKSAQFRKMRDRLTESRRSANATSAFYAGGARAAGREPAARSRLLLSRPVPQFYEPD